MKYQNYHCKLKPITDKSKKSISFAIKTYDCSRELKSNIDQNAENICKETIYKLYIKSQKFQNTQVSKLKLFQEFSYSQGVV